MKLPEHMLDTDVIVRAVKVTARIVYPGDTDQDKHKDEMARDLVLRQDTIRIAAHTAFELQWMGPAAAKVVDEFLGRAHIDAFGPDEQREAAAIAKRCIERKHFCARCWSHEPVSACGTCGAKGSRWRKLNDVYIAATASKADGVSTFYTYDLRDYRQLLDGSTVTVREPEDYNPLMRNAIGLAPTAAPAAVPKGRRRA